MVAADQAKSHVVTVKDHGKKITLHKGDKLAVKLPQTAGTGYLWAIVKNDAEQMAPVGKVEVVPSKDKKLVGGPQTAIFRFEAKKAGKSDLELHYHRPFEKDKPPAKTFKISVVIEP